MVSFLDNIGLAPMEGVSDLATRLWLSLTSRPPWAITPFLRITENFPAKRIPATFAPESGLWKETVPYTLYPQLMGTDPAHISSIGKHLLDHGAPGVDLNCGCPAPTVVGHRAGSALLKDPIGLRDFLKRLLAQTPQHTWSVKMRLGFAEDGEFPALWEALQGLGLSHVTIHGRTRENRYLTEARWEPLYQAASSAGLPIVGSGDITTHMSAPLHHTPQPLAGALIGRGALRNPWIFEEIRLQKKVFLTGRTFATSLAVFAGLQAALYTAPQTLLKLMETQLFLSANFENEEKWLSTLETLQSMLRYPADIAGWPLDPKTLCRVKMIFHYSRFSLPSGHLTAPLMRASTWTLFWEALLDFLSKHCPAPFSLSPQSEHDWVFSGGTNPHKGHQQ